MSARREMVLFLVALYGVEFLDELVYGCKARYCLFWEVE